jgi:hypothetical protein
MFKRTIVVGCVLVAFFAHAQNEPGLLITLELNPANAARHSRSCHPRASRAVRRQV